MFEIANSTIDLVNYSVDLWKRYDKYGKPRPSIMPYNLAYPCLFTAVVTNEVYLPTDGSSRRKSFIFVFCRKNEAKRLIYPGTNKDRKCAGQDSFTFVGSVSDINRYIRETYERYKSWRVNYDSAEQKELSYELERYIIRLSAKEFPCLIKHRNYYVGGSHVLNFFIVRRPAAKALVYWKKNHKSSGWKGSEPSATVGHHVSSVATCDYIIRHPAGETPNITLKVDLNGGQVIRFRQDFEVSVRSGESRQLIKYNKKINNYVWGSRHCSNDYLKGSVRQEIDSFNRWRVHNRNSLARRYPGLVIANSVSEGRPTDHPSIPHSWAVGESDTVEQRLRETFYNKTRKECVDEADTVGMRRVERPLLFKHFDSLDVVKNSKKKKVEVE